MSVAGPDFSTNSGNRMNPHPESGSDGAGQPPVDQNPTSDQQANRDKFMTPQLMIAPRV